MSTPASQALSDANTTPAPAASADPAASGGTPTPSAQQVADKFWGSWNLPDQKETREWVANKNYESPYTLAKTAQTLEREAATLRAGKGYPVDKAGPDGKVTRDENAWKAWGALTGVPESPDKYDLPVNVNNPYPQFKTFMSEALFKAGVPAAMAPALAKGYEEAYVRMETDLKAQEDSRSQQALMELERTWGPNYKERMSFAARGKEWLSNETGGLSDLQLRVLESTLGTDKFLTAMWKLGSGNREASFPNSGESAGFSGGASEAQARLDQITADRSAGKISDFAWRDKYEKEATTLAQRIADGMASPH